MQRSIQTTIGSGNRFTDLTFVWFASAADSLVQGRMGHSELAARVGLSLLDFAEPWEGETAIRALFAKGLVEPSPAATTADVASAVVQLSGALEDQAARRTFAAEFSRWVASERSSALSEVLRANDDDLRTASRVELQDNLMRALDGPVVVVEHSPPTAESVMSLLSKGSGVALGAYIGFAVAQDASPLLLFASVPGGMLVCGTAAGVADALQKGLRHRMLAWILGASKQQVRSAVSKTLESLFPESYEVIRPDAGAGNARER